MQWTTTRLALAAGAVTLSLGSVWVLHAQRRASWELLSTEGFKPTAVPQRPDLLEDLRGLGYLEDGE